MCITKVESFEFAGKLYSTERLALEAAITEAGARLVKNHSANPGAGLMNQCSELVPLLARFCEIASAGAATEVASEKRQRGPKGPLDAETMGDVNEDQVASIIRRAAKINKERTKVFLKSIGFNELSELLDSPHLYKKAFAWANNFILESKA